MRRDKYLSRKELDALIASAKAGHPLTWLCVDMALQTGLRVGELALLTVEDFDLERGLLHVWRTKKKKPTRGIIGLSPSMLRHLRKHLDGVDSGSIWIGQRGPWTKRGLQQAWTRACAAAGISGVSIHGARHTIAVHLLKETGCLRLVQKQLGHTSPTTTANLYADVPFEDQVAALAKVFS